MKLFIAALAMLSAYVGAAMGIAVVDNDRRQTGPSCTTGSAIPNPVVLSVNSGVPVSITAQSHAANLQKLTIIKAGATVAVFQGSGEDVPMPIISGGTGNSFSISAQNAYQLTLSFAFSTNRGSTFSVPTVRCPNIIPAGNMITIGTIVTEDASDNDDNDTLATVVFS